MVTIDVRYLGELRCEATHAPSRQSLTTDAPVDNGGRGDSFSPTDLVATALGTCMMTIMGKVAERHGWRLDGLTVSVAKHMVADPLRRIGKLEVVFTMPRAFADRERQILEQAAFTCPVHKSLHTAIEIPVKFLYPS